MKTYKISEEEAAKLLQKNSWTSVIVGQRNVLETIKNIKSNATKFLEDFEFQFRSSTMSSVKTAENTLYLQIRPLHKVKYLGSTSYRKTDFDMLNNDVEFLVASSFDLNTPSQLLVETQGGDVDVWEYLASKEPVTRFVAMNELATLLA